MDRLLRLGIPIVTMGISILVAIFEAYHLAEDVNKDPVALADWSLAFLLVIVGLVFGYSVYRIVQTIKKEQYANITTYIHDIQHGIRNLTTLLDQQLDSALETGTFPNVQVLFRARLVEILSSISNLFSMLTGTNCRACIKTTFPLDGVVYMQTLARDNRADRACFDRDERRRKERMDPLSLNSEFLRMMQMRKDGPGEWHFICDDVEANAQFFSTSKAAYALNIGTHRRAFWEFWKQKPRALPYRSTVCSAIGQAPDRDIEPLVAYNGSATVIGFLAVDSESRDAFERRWDVQLIYSFADSLFHPLNRYIVAFRKASALNGEDGTR